LDLGDADGARRELERALGEAGDETDVAVLDALGAGLRRVGAPLPAMRALRLAIEHEATAARWTELALAAASAERGSEAESALHRAIQLDASFAPAHYYLGRMLAARGAADEARGALEQARSLDPSGPVGERAGRALTELGAPTPRGRPRN
jgi:tetratricopeptide (TPR) repeat protein